MSDPTKPDDEWQKRFGELLRSYGEAQQTENVKETTAASIKVWEHFAKHKSEPSPWLDAMKRAHQCEAAFDWAGAQSAYEVAAQAEANSPGLQSSAYWQLCSLHRMLGQKELAAKAERTAIDLGKRGDKIPYRVPALCAEAQLCVQAHDLPLAWSIIADLFDSLPNDAMHKVSRTQALIQRANYFLETGEMAKAEDDLNSAWKILEPWEKDVFAAGIQNCFAKWWTTTANLLSRQGDLKSVVAARRQVVLYRRRIAQAPQLEGPYKHNSLAQALYDLGKALEAVGDLLARDSFKESNSIRRTIGLPPLAEMAV